MPIVSFIKPLEWSFLKLINEHTADGIHTYYVQEDSSGKFNTYQNRTFIGAFTTLEEAKDAAQKDHNKQIRKFIQLPFRDITSDIRTIPLAILTNETGIYVADARTQEVLKDFKTIEEAEKYVTDIICEANHE